MTEPDNNDTQDELPDFVDRFLGLPEDQQGTPDCQKTVAWLAGEVVRLQAEATKSRLLAQSQAAQVLRLEEAVNEARAALDAARFELRVVSLKASNFAVPERRIQEGELRVSLKKTGRPREIEPREWDAILMYARLCNTDAAGPRRAGPRRNDAAVALRLAEMQWRAKNPLRTRLDAREIQRLQATWKMGISRARKQLSLPVGSLAEATEYGKALRAELETTLDRVIGRRAKKISK